MHIREKKRNNRIIYQEGYCITAIYFSSDGSEQRSSLLYRVICSSICIDHARVHSRMPVPFTPSTRCLSVESSVFGPELPFLSVVFEVQQEMVVVEKQLLARQGGTLLRWSGRPHRHLGFHDFEAWLHRDYFHFF